MNIIATFLEKLILVLVLGAIGLGIITLVMMYIYWIIDDMRAIFGK